MNDPFDGGMHIPDIFIVQPIFWRGEKVAFAVTTAHHADLGGRLPGSAACDNTEIFQDGFRMPWLKLYQYGEPNEAVFTLLRANVRVPHMVLGDIRAQLAACHMGEAAIHDILQRYGVNTFRQCCLDLIDYTERLLRESIRSWPKKIYTFVDFMDSDGVGGPPVKIEVALRTDEDTLIADFSGTASQVQGAINCTFSFTAAVVAMCVRQMVQDDIPNTAGMFRPLKIIAPPGSVVNCVMPAASSMRGITGFRIADAVLGAFAQMLPDRVIAAGEGGNSLIIIGGRENTATNGGPFVFYELMSGTWGAMAGHDGNDGLCNPANVASNIPIEQAECEYPIRVERYGFAQDSGGERSVPRRRSRGARMEPSIWKGPPGYSL